QRESEPWLLASNLPEAQWNAARVVAIYKWRMQVEEGLRDLKSHRLGFGLELHRSRCPRRIEILLLIAVLANYALCLLGLQAREAEHERCFQSNSLKCKHVLSLWRLGLEYARGYAGDISQETLCRLELALRQEVHRQARELR
ncbi:IS4 family transposase, partial [Azorhizophilus paspali]